MKTSGDDGKEANEFFEYWSNLAKKEPQRFTEERIKLIEVVISSASPEHQLVLRQLQWRIDGEILKAGSPYLAAVRLNEMMLDYYHSPEGFAAIPGLVKKAHELAEDNREAARHIKVQIGRLKELNEELIDCMQKLKRLANS